MASIRRLKKDDKTSPWIVEYTDRDGKRRRKTPKSGLMKDAEKLRQQIEREMSDGIHVPASQTAKINDVLDGWLAECDRRVEAKDRLRRVTVNANRVISTKRIRPHLGNILAADLTLRQVQAWIDRLSYEEKAGRPTVQAALGALRLALKYAQRQSLVTRNVLQDGVVRVPGRASAPIAIPSKDEVRQLLAGSDLRQRGGSAPYLRVMLHLAVYAGLRAGEIRGLHWEHIDLAGGMVRVRQAMDRWGAVDEPKTPAAIRDIPMPPALAHELRQWSMKCGRPESGLVFTGRGGWVQMGALDQAWRRLARRVFEGVAKRETPDPSPYHFHALRHVYASLLIEAGLPPKRVQYLMGHASITITFDRYGHLFEDPELVRGAMERLGSGIAAPV